MINLKVESCILLIDFSISFFIFLKHYVWFIIDHTALGSKVIIELVSSVRPSVCSSVNALTVKPIDL